MVELSEIMCRMAEDGGCCPAIDELIQKAEALEAERDALKAELATNELKAGYYDDHKKLLASNGCDTVEGLIGAYRSIQRQLEHANSELETTKDNYMDILSDVTDAKTLMRDRGIDQDEFPKMFASYKAAAEKDRAELEAEKENHRLHAARLISEKILVSEQLEAARNQEPCGYFYLLDFSDTTIYQNKSGDDNYAPLYAKPVPAQPSAEQTTDVLETFEKLRSLSDPDALDPQMLLAELRDHESLSVELTAVSKFLATAEVLIDSHPYLYAEIARTRTTGWMAWLRIKPDGELIACGQGETAEEACAQALLELEKNGGNSV